MTSAIFHIKEHILPGQHIREYARATAFEQEAPLNLAIKQYIPIDNPNPQPGDVTIIGAHANGFPKELYEPLWIELHARSKANGFRIRGIWIADVAQQGASSALNEHLLGNDPSWMDHPRDLLHIINHFRAEMPLPLIGIGHSMGACQLVNLSLIHPRLFTTLILMEPVIQRYSIADPGLANSGRLPARASTFRRDIWPSKGAAIAAFKKQPFYQAWDGRVLDLWINHGIRAAPTALYPDEYSGAITLSTTRHQEVWTFLRPLFADPPLPGTASLPPRAVYPDTDRTTSSGGLPFYRPEPPSTFARLPHLRPPTLYIFGATSDMSTPPQIADKLAATGTGIGGSGGVKEGRVKALTLEGIGHLVAMEAVGRCADAIAPWVGSGVAEWEAALLAFREWTRLPLRERQEVSEEWKTKLGGPLPKPVKGKI